MTVAYLIRHGESELNRGGVFRGTVDVPLNEHGRLQAEALGRALAKTRLDAVFSSPLARAFDTAHAVALPHRREVCIDKAFGNINLGEWQGKPKAQVARDYPEEWRLWTSNPERLLVPGGESVGEVRERAWRRLAALVTGECRGQRIAIVTHRTVIKAVLGAVLGLDRDYFWKFYLDPASYTVVMHSDEAGFYLYQMNVTTVIPPSAMEVF
ncbi:MAG: histidine phosphatase family protein [Candidatus Eisenbacteria bacterium]|jgi:probable phosphoglycerate mutase|nr:histidine phosphatase family protein [Candidatus Eisenbacteria bacterium]